MSWPIYIYEDKADYNYFVHCYINQMEGFPILAIGYRIRSGRGYYPPQLKIYLVKDLPYPSGMRWKWREQ